MTTFTATAYGPPWVFSNGDPGTGVTATGLDLRANPKQYVVAVDPAIIPLGSKLKIWPNPFGDPNIVFNAADTGGAIKGNKIDFYDWRGSTSQKAWGVRGVAVTLLDRNTMSTNATGASTGSPPPPGAPPPPSTTGGGGSGQPDFLGSLVKGLLYMALVGGAAALVWYGTKTTLAPARKTPA